MTITTNKSVTYATLLVTSPLFSYCLSDKKRWKKAAILLTLGLALRQLGQYSKTDTIKNIGSSILNSCVFTSIGMSIGGPVWFIDENLLGKVLGSCLGLIAGLNAFQGVHSYARKRCEASHSAVTLIDNSLKFLLLELI